MRRVIAVITAASAALLVTPATSAAAPSERETFTLQCDGGRELVVAVNNGNGAFTAARVVGTKQMFIPIDFGEFTFTATSPEGEVLFEGSDPALTKGQVSMHNPQPTLACSIDEVEVVTEDHPSGLPVGTVLTFSGDVTGFLTGR